MIATSQGRLQDRRPLSIIDIGSNSIRLVIYEGHSALADGAVQREDAGRSRPRHRLDRQARSGGGRRARWRSSVASARCRTRPAPSSSMSSRRRPPARPKTARISSIAPKQVLGTEIRVLSGARGGLLFRARRHLRLSSGQRHCRRSRRRQPGTGRRQRRGDRRRHHAAAGRPAAAGHVQELARRRGKDRARASLPGQSC